MKRQAYILIFILLLVAGKAYGSQPQGSLSANGPFCTTGAGTLTWTATNGTDPFTIVYNDGVADRTVSGVSSGVPFAVFTTPVTSTTTYILQSVTDAGGTRNGGFTNGSATITIKVAPTASAGGSHAICQTGSATVSGASSANGTRLWTDDGFGSLSGTTGLTPTYTAAAADAGNTVTLTLTVSNSLCSDATATYSVIVDALPTSTAGGSQTICQNGTATVSGATSSNGTIAWTENGAGTITSGATTLTPTYTSAAGDAGNTVTLTMTVTSNNTCGSATATATYLVHVDALPTATAGGNQTICQNGTATVSGATATHGTIAWTEDGAGSITTGATTLTPIYTAAAGDAGNTVTLTMTVTSNNTCGSATATATYFVIVDPIPTLGLVSQTAAICSGSAATINLTELLASSTSTVAYSINGVPQTVVSGVIANGSGEASFNTPALSAANNGLILQITGITATSLPANCSGTFALNTTLIVNSASVPTITGNAAPCINSSGNVYTTQPGMSGYTWTVSGGGTIFSGAGTNAITVTWNASGGQTVSVNYTNTLGCIAASATSYLVTVSALPVPTITGPASVCVGSAGNIYTTEVGKPTYTWTVSGGGTINAGGTGNMIIVTWNAGGPQSISVNYTNSSGCSAASATVSNITVNPLPIPTISGNPSACVGSVGNIYTTESLMSAYSWLVSPGGTITSGTGTNVITVTWNTAVAQMVSVNYTNGNSCTATSAPVKNITINALPVPIITGNAVVNVASTGNVYSTEGSMTGYVWNVSSGGAIAGGAGTNSITVTWNTAGSQTVSVNYINGNSCTEVSPVVKTVSVNAIPLAGSISISGTSKVGSLLTANYQYSDADGDPEGSSTIQWFRDLDGTGISWSSIAAPSTSKTYTLTNLEYGKLVRFELTPVAASGALNGILYTSGNSAVITNPAPVASTPTISGLLNVGEILTGHYTYSDAEGDLESGSSFQWYSSGTLLGTYLPISETNITHVITIGEQGKYFKIYVTPRAATGTTTGTEVASEGYGPGNMKPAASGLNIAGVVAIGSTLNANYSYFDTDGDLQGTSTFRWFRDGVMIPGATSNNYTVTVNDEGYKLSFEVTPVSATGYPNIGDAVLSSETVKVPISVALPVVSELCIEGVRSVGSIIKGKYVYSYPYGSDLSKFRWVRDLTDTIPGATSTTYTLTGADISHDITFVIYPYSDLPAHKRGITAKSNSLIRTIWPTTSYSLADPSVTLVSNVGTGVFSGPGVSNGVFSPSSATSVGSPHTIFGNLSIVNSSTTCSQQTSDLITVIPINAFFNSFKNVYCHDGGIDTISVANVSLTATSMTFRLTNTSAQIRLLDPKTIIIDPGRMRPGDKKDTLFFSYRDGVSLFAISRPFVVDSVGTNMTMLNIDPAYCEGGVKHYVTVEGTYPGGGTANWTGTLMADQTPTSSFLDPLLGIAGITYPISYQYISPLGCKSTIINKSVKINPLPNSSFTLDATYNIDGGNKNLVAVTPGGNFVGPGIIGTKFYPDIAGQGTFNIVYYMTDINNCSSSTTKTTTIRKVQGAYNNPPAIVCYRDTTYTVSVSGLPSGITILDFVNSKNSVVHVPGASTATYRIPDARAGNDTLKFSYTWDGVNYILSKPVFIDSIGKIAITGLKDNYCDYEGTASLRVLVENSTGNGNFSFSGPATSFTNFGSVADFFPSLTPTSAAPYLVSYTHVSTVNNSGCRKTVDVPVTVNKAPTVSILKTRTTINIEETPVLLQGVPTNGIFSGKGVYKQGSDYVFNPLVSGLGNIGIQLAYVDTKGCSTVDKDTLIVSAATGTINGININSQYCIDGLSDTLKYIPVNPYLAGSFIGDGISNIATEKATFNPAWAGKGDHRIAFRYADLKGTIFEVPAILKVDEIGQILINLNPGSVYCNTDSKVPLVPSVQGGVYSGPVTDNSLDPAKQVGNTSVGYIYTNSKTGCSSTINVPITINAVPVISFLPAEVCIAGGKDIPFTNSTTSIDPVSIWKWEFADDATTSGDKAPSHHYKSGGFQQVTLTATTVNSCHSTKSITFEVGQRPTADFYWKNECLQPNDSVQLVNSTISTSAIVTQSWSILGGAEFSTKPNAAYPKITTGFLSIQYVVRTKYANCYDTVRKNIYIRPSISLATDNYFENFESGRGGWVKELEADSTWSFGKPDRTTIKSAASGNSAWFIHSSLSHQKIAHPVISPCFDFTFAKRPMISLNLFKRFVKNEDGAVLQYMIGDGSWQPLGTVSDDGIQWFNSAVIKGKPGLDQLGWTTLDTADTKWKTVYHKLDDLNGKKNVKFRISYGADSTFTSYDDGIAFDDIFIGERTRKVLVEHFTNSSPLSSVAAGMVNIISQNSKNDVINIQYHTNFPYPDLYYDDNPGDASARILFYGLIRTPYSFVDGGNDGANFANYYDYNQSGTSINSNDVIRRSLLSPGFDISLTTTVSGGVLTVSGKITALQNISSDNSLTLYLAVTEKKNSQHPVTGGDAIFYNVFRKFLPDAGGINLKKTWTKGETYILAEKTWVIEKIQNASDIDVISFIQDNVKREIYQAASKTEANIIVGIENLYGGKGTDFALYPNPAVNKLTISFEEPLTADADIKIYDLQGTVIKTYKAGSGSSEFTIDNIGLKGGIYMVRVSVGVKNLGFKKLIVSAD